MSNVVFLREPGEEVCSLMQEFLRNSKDASYLGIIWRVILNNPVDFRNIQPSGCHVCAQQYPSICIAKLEECGCTLILLLPSLESNQNVYYSWELEAVLGRSRCRTPKLWSCEPPLLQVHSLACNFPKQVMSLIPLWQSPLNTQQRSPSPGDQDQSPNVDRPMFRGQ